MSNIDRPRGTRGLPVAVPAGSPPPAAPRASVTLPAPVRATSADLPSAAGTAVLDLSPDQIARIRVLLIAMRLGKVVVDDVRRQIYDMLSGGQRRMAGAAYFILSVRA